MLITSIAPMLIGWALTINGPGLTNHGKLAPDSYHLMKHRIGASSVIHPVEFGLGVKTDHFQSDVTYLKDCFGHSAGIAVAGTKVDFFSYFAFGGVVGIYARESMSSGDFPLVQKVGSVDIIPIGGATFSIKVPVSKTISVETNTLSNFYITHTNLGLRLDF